VGNIYQYIQNQIQEDELKEDKSDNKLTERVKDEIQRDLKRTFTSERMKTEEGQEEMRRVLEAIAYSMTEVGYC
jgi:hypothetical protein